MIFGHRAKSGIDKAFGVRGVVTDLRLRGMWSKLARGAPQFGIVAFGLCALLLVEWMLETRLITTDNGTYFATNDGKMAEGVVRTAYRFAGWFNLTNLNPLQGVGSQILPLNVWANCAAMTLGSGGKSKQRAIT